MSFVAFRSLCLALVLGAGLSAVHAGKPQWIEDGHPHKEKDRHGHRGGDERRDDRRSEGPRPMAGPQGVSVQVQIGGYFNDGQRQSTRAYYEPRFRSGHCPRGLAKKHNGCMPPGQARYWHRGEPLPPAVVYYPVPASVQVRLGTPPAGHKFVRVASDILLIAVGSGMVIDAIEDLGGQ